jgi:hypothetical protein
VEIGDKSRRISARSVEFFADWLAERRALVELEDPAQDREVDAWFDSADTFWQGLAAEANAP